jgi:hypothetical protein
MKLIEWPYYRKEFLLSQGFSTTFAERFWNKVRIAEGCWTWTASPSVGYGQLPRGPHAAGCTKAHVASWILHFGPIPEHQCVLHACDNRRCVNPAHLFLGTQRDNLDDMRIKGRAAIGEAHGRAKLTEPQALAIRNRYRKGSRWHRRGNAKELAQEFGISIAQIVGIAQGRNWFHLTDH